MKYRLNKNFGTIDDGIDPSSLICLYIGESDNADSIPDYAMYLGSVNVIKKFIASDHVNKCEEWKKKTKILKKQNRNKKPKLKKKKQAKLVNHQQIFLHRISDWISHLATVYQKRA